MLTQKYLCYTPAKITSRFCLYSCSEIKVFISSSSRSLSAVLFPPVGTTALIKGEVKVEPEADPTATSM